MGGDAKRRWRKIGGSRESKGSRGAGRCCEFVGRGVVVGFLCWADIVLDILVLLRWLGGGASSGLDGDGVVIFSFSVNFVCLSRFI